MHAALDLDQLLQFLVSEATAMAAAFLNLVRSTSSMVFAAASNFGLTGADFTPDFNDGEMMEAAVGGAAVDCCAWRGFTPGRQLAGGEMVEHCSESCQSSHWNSEHETKCAHTKSPYALRGRKVSLLSAIGSSETHERSNEILFPYEEFVQFFNWEKPGYPPCGLINCGNSCFANVVLQCLTYTRPLATYFLEKNHKIECRMDTWCFLCEFQNHVKRASWSHTAFIPINIISRLHNIGGNLEHGKEEDAHEFMRFAIDKMQSAFLYEFGGEKAVHPRYQETNLVQHIFGGCLQSQVICSKCNNVSNQFEHMMDLTVEIHENAGSLEECLDQFTAEEWLHGDNMYKCDCCSAYVTAQKRLTIQQAPNILTIALKRFQSGRFNMLKKRVTFPETLNLSSYMTELEDGNNVYKLYAVIVHVDMLNASFSGHYICYVKDFSGNWYRINDDKVSTVGLDEVLSQGAYMLLYSRICARPTCLLPAALLKERENEKVKIQTVDLSTTQLVNSSHMSPEVETNSGEEFSFVKSVEDAGEDVDMVPCHSGLPTVSIRSHDSDGFCNSPKEGAFPLKPDFYKASAGFDVENVRPCNRRDTNEARLRMPCQDSGAAQNWTYEKDRRYCDISSFTTGEVQNVNSANCSYMHVNAVCEGNESISPDDGHIDAAAKKPNGERFGAKSNPIFAPRSLGRQPWESFIKQENRVSEVYSSVTPDDDTKDAAPRISVGLSSEVKLKPLSALGGKRRKELFKQENGASAGLGGTMPRINLNPWYLSENGRCLKYE
ncbi:ubiquitin-specific protease 18 [Perilla frutescens var. hirtella]|nr:ubiquitin-specific protease 18 [Perilla frutescens var. frutescens]KAH6792274.1 ubiquitin-specific protease 18 [Perilla frutescens var. hirtella]